MVLLPAASLSAFLAAARDHAGREQLFATVDTYDIIILSIFIQCSAGKPIDISDRIVHNHI